MLREWHQRVLGPAAAMGHLQPGLLALTAGILLGGAGVGLYLAGEATGGSLAWRQAAIAMAATACPLIFGGLSLALPARPWLRIAAGSGAAVNLAAVALFVAHYPGRFNATALGSDRAPADAAIYAFGSAVLAGSLLAQVVGVYVRGRTAEEDAWTEAGYDVPDWVVEKDIDDAMKRHPVNWAGAAPLPQGVRIHVASFGEETIIHGDGAASRVALAMPDLEQKSQRLRGMGAAVSVPDAPLVHATAALGELRRLQAADPKRYRVRRRSWWRRLLGR